MNAAAQVRWSRLLRACLGRRTLIRLGRFLWRAGRMEFPNDTRWNGEPWVQDVFLQHARTNGPVVFDVGAHEGRWTQSLVERARHRGRRDLRVYAFEPCAGTWNRLTRTCASLRNAVAEMKPIQVALADQAGEADFHVVADGAGRNSLLPLMEEDATRLETVPVTTIDLYVHENAIERIDFLKIDAEGADYRVLQGARETFERGRLGLVQLEYNQRWILARSFLRDVFEYFRGSGYGIGKITPEGLELYAGWDWRLETFAEANYLCIPSEWLSRFARIAPVL